MHRGFRILEPRERDHHTLSPHHTQARSNRETARSFSSNREYYSRSPGSTSRNKTDNNEDKYQKNREHRKSPIPSNNYGNSAIYGGGLEMLDDL